MKNVDIFDIEELKMAVRGQERAVGVNEEGGILFESWDDYVLDEKDSNDENDAAVANTLLEKYDNLSKKGKKKFNKAISRCESILRDSEMSEDEENMDIVDMYWERIISKEMDDFLM